MWPPLALQAVEPLCFHRGIGQTVSRGGQVLQEDLALMPAGLEEHLGGGGERLRAESDSCPGDVWVPLQEAPDQGPVPLQVLLQVLLPRLIALEDHVEEVGGVGEGVQGPVQGGVRGEARLAGEAGQLVPPGAVGTPQLPGVARVEERGHVLGHLLGEPLRQDGALRRAAPRGGQRLPALDVVVNRLPPSERPIPAAHRLPLAGASPETPLGEEQEEKEPKQSHVPRRSRSRRHGEVAGDGLPAGGRGAGARTSRGGQAGRKTAPGPRVTCGGTARALPSAGRRAAPPPARSGSQPLRRRQRLQRARLRLLAPRPPRSLSCSPAQRAEAAAPGAAAGSPAAPRRRPRPAAPHPSGAAAGEGSPRRGTATCCGDQRGQPGGAAAEAPASASARVSEREPPVWEAAHRAVPPRAARHPFPAGPYRCTPGSCRPVWPLRLSVSRQPFTGQEAAPCGAERGGAAAAERRRGTSLHLLPAQLGAEAGEPPTAPAAAPHSPRLGSGGPGRRTDPRGLHRAAPRARSGPRGLPGECGSDTCWPGVERRRCTLRLRAGGDSAGAAGQRPLGLRGRRGCWG